MFQRRDDSSAYVISSMVPTNPLHGLNRRCVNAESDSGVFKFTFPASNRLSLIRAENHFKPLLNSSINNEAHYRKKMK